MNFLACVVLGNAFGDHQRIGTGWAGIIEANRPEEVPALARARHAKSDCRAYPEWIIGVEVRSVPDEELLLAAE